MKVAFVSIQDVHNVRSWSGIPYSTYHHMSKKADVRPISPISFRESLWLKAKKRFYKSAKRGRFYPHYHPDAMKSFGQEVDRQVGDADVIFSIFPDPAVYAQSSKPWFFFGDATFASLHRLYPALRDLAPETVRAGHRFWQDGLDRATGAIFSCDWAAQSAIEDYGADPSRVHVVPMGANVPERVSLETVQQALAERPQNRCNLLWMGVDWERKGGDEAVAVMQELRKQGIPATLQIAGLTEDQIGPQPEGVTALGFVGKSTPEGRKTWVECFLNADYFVFPTRAEASGLVLGEASAFGLPSMTTNVGGLASTVVDGVNGYTFPLESFVESAVSEILRLSADREAYNALSLSSFNRYETDLNWDVFSDRLIDIFSQSVGTATSN